MTWFAYFQSEKREADILGEVDRQKFFEKGSLSESLHD